MPKMLTQESVEILRKAAQLDYKLVFSDFEDLVETHQLKLIDTPFDIEGLPFVMPTGIYQATSGDNENCTLVYKRLKNLTAAQATDERFWVTQGFTIGKDYAISRWPFREDASENENGDAPSNNPKKTPNQKNTSNLINHWFCKGIRGRMRDHAISRLWWMGYIARRIDPENPEAIYETLFFKTDYRASLLERSTSANAVNVVIAILKLSHGYTKEGIAYDRDKFREFMKQVDFIGKRTSLPAMDEKQIMEILEPEYKKQYSIPTSSKSLISRILGG